MEVGGEGDKKGSEKFFTEVCSFVWVGVREKSASLLEKRGTQKNELLLSEVFGFISALLRAKQNVVLCCALFSACCFISEFAFAFA